MLKFLQLICFITLFAYQLISNAACTKEMQRAHDRMDLQRLLSGGDDTLSLLPSDCDKPGELKISREAIWQKFNEKPAPLTPRTNNKDDPINLDPAIFKQYYGYDKPTGPVDTWPVDIRRRLRLD